ncbi:hypothetical protein QQ045_010999 [Rhodiola kirilowii]
MLQFVLHTQSQIANPAETLLSFSNHNSQLVSNILPSPVTRPAVQQPSRFLNSPRLILQPSSPAASSSVATHNLRLLLNFLAAEENSFICTGGRHLTSYRSRLKPKIVQALVCTQDWLRLRTRTNNSNENSDTDSNDNDSEEDDEDEGTFYNGFLELKNEEWIFGIEESRMQKQNETCSLESVQSCSLTCDSSLVDGRATNFDNGVQLQAVKYIVKGT